MKKRIFSGLRILTSLVAVLFVFFDLTPVQATTYVVDKTITWGDSTTESLKIDTDYNIYLDDALFTPVGIDINRDTPYGDDASAVDCLYFYHSELDYLESIGVRVVHIQLAPMDSDISGYYSDLLNLCYDHKMLVFALITCRWYMPVDLTPSDFTISSGSKASDFIQRCCTLLNMYDNILAISADNEIDLKHTEYHGAENYDVTAAEDYIHFMTDEIRADSPGIPVTTKLVGQPDSGFREKVRDSVYPYLDFMTFDSYTASLSAYNTLAKYLRNWQNTSTTFNDTQTIWYGETNAGTYPSNALNFTRDYVDYAHSSNITTILLWTSYYSKSQQNGFFTGSGYIATPKSSLTTLGSVLDDLQYPEGEPEQTITVSYGSWDINQDSIINALDMIEINQHLGETGADGWIKEDVNNDGIVNILDSILVGQHWMP
jgi:hypothetical protein